LKRLLILRHAKAVPADATGDDATRDLNPRGHADAARLGAWLAAHNMAPAHILCSPAHRTRQTFEDVSQALGRSPKATFPESLYLASVRTLLAEARKTVDSAQSLMLVGHNPGLENLALHLVRKPKTEAQKKHLRAMAEGFPTCALAVLDFDVENWKQLAAASADIVVYIRPKDLSS